MMALNARVMLLGIHKCTFNTPNGHPCSHTHMHTHGRVHTAIFTRRAYRSRTVRVQLPVYTLRPLRRVRPVHSDHIGRCSQWTRTVRVGLALQCECSSGRVGYSSDAPSAHVCRLTYFFPVRYFLMLRIALVRIIIMRCKSDFGF